MIGCFAFIPAKTEKRNKVFKEHMGKVKAILEDGKDLTSSDALGKLYELGVQTEYMMELNDDEPETLEEIGQLYDNVMENEQVSHCRDMAATEIKVNGERVNVFFAGDMSWGDEPEGAGYEQLEAMRKIGLLAAFEQSIDWGKK